MALVAGVLALAGCSSSGSVKQSPTGQGLSGNPSSVIGSPAPSSSPSSRFSGRVTFRPVAWQSTDGTPVPSPSADTESGAVTALSALDCAKSQSTATPAVPAATPDTAYLAACSSDGKTKYLLAPSALSGERVSKAAIAVSTGGNGWEVDVTLDSQGAKAFADLTTSLAGTNKPLAITVGTTVVSAPIVQSAITGGEIAINGGLNDRTQAEDLAGALTAGAKG